MSATKEYYHNKIEKAMKTSKFRIVGIQEPGIVNVLLDGRFQDVHLHDADDATLEKLYKDECPYIQMTPEGVLATDPTLKKIETVLLKGKKKS